MISLKQILVIFIFSPLLEVFVMMCGYSVQVIAKHYALKVSWMKHFLSHIDFDTRESAARLLGIASSALTTSASSAVMKELLTSISGIHNLRFIYLMKMVIQESYFCLL